MMVLRRELETELAELLHFAGTVAWAARMHSHYLPATAEEFRLQEHRVERRPFGVDVFHLTDALCHLGDVGQAVAMGDRLRISRACHAALTAFAAYTSEHATPPYSAARTFEIWSDTIHLDEARTALQSIQAKNWLRSNTRQR